jgi:hypothetical protein
MSKQIPTPTKANTALAILASAFGDKYYAWISLPSDTLVLEEEEKKILNELIQERDHYEIKKTIKKLRKVTFLAE